MARFDHLHQTASGQIGALCLKVQLCLIAGNDSGRIQRHNGCTIVRQLLGVCFRINIRHIRFPEVRLDHPPRIVRPPVFYVHSASLHPLRWITPSALAKIFFKVDLCRLLFGQSGIQHF